MDQVRMRDDDSTPRLTGSSAASLIQADPLLPTPSGREFDTEHLASRSPSLSTANFQYAERSWLSSMQSLCSKLAYPIFGPPRSKPLFRGFERPSFSRITILTVLCLLTYPAFYLLTLVAKDKSLFVVRSVVAVVCWGFGFALGWVLLKIGAQHLEAATWATVIHKSYEGGNGMKLRDLARSSSDPKSFTPAFHLLQSRFGSQRTSRRSRKSHDKRPWSLLLGFFVVLATLAPALNFLFGRIIVINTFISNQYKAYHEVLIAGDLSQEDIDRATIQLGESKNLSRIWSLLAYGRSESDTAEFVYGDDTVYFAQPSPSQFVTGGVGPGTFNQLELTGPKDTPANTLPLTSRNTPKSDTGVVLRYPQWGLRIHCEKLPDPEVNLIPFSVEHPYTNAYVPREFLRGLFGGFGMDLPTQFTGPTETPQPLDNITMNIDLSKISYVLTWLRHGEAMTFDSRDVDTVGDQEWVTVKTVILRFQTDSTPSGHFPVSGTGSMSVALGYDSAVCVEKYEPWIVEMYNTSIASPSTLRIVEKGNGSNSSSPSGKIRGTPIPNTGYLNTTGKGPAFAVANVNSINQMMKDSVGDFLYVPSLTAVSFTNGTGLLGYTELSPDRLTIALGQVGAAHTLPYLAGSRTIVAKSYEDETLAYTTFNRWQLIALPILVWILGVIGELFVPSLPLNIPRRGFGVYSWLALFQSQELRFEATDELEKFAPLEELEERFSDKRVRFAVEEGDKNN